MSGRIQLGTSGFVYRDWRGILYRAGLPARRWLERYGGVFSTVELNATFYRLPDAQAVERWRAAVPPDFRFSAKGSRFLTHMKRLTDAGPGLARFYERVLRLREKLDVVLWQLPPGMKTAELERLDAFLKAQPPGLRQAVEFRHEAWYTEDVCRVLDAHGAAFCEHDLVQRRPPRLTGGFRYLRFHGAGAKYSGRYGRSALAPAARDLDRWRAAGGDAYVYFNNDRQGAALYDARALAGLLDIPLDLDLPEVSSGGEHHHERRAAVGIHRHAGAHQHAAL